MFCSSIPPTWIPPTTLTLVFLSSMVGAFLGRARNSAGAMVRARLAPLRPMAEIRLSDLVALAAAGRAVDVLFRGFAHGGLVPQGDERICICIGFGICLLSGYSVDVGLSISCFLLMEWS